jgi:8-oxo-dGTP pyrophosphatase MutT (NUDIX family)
VLDRDDDVLLVRFVVETTQFWATPGGGVDSGETDEKATVHDLVEHGPPPEPGDAASRELDWEHDRRWSRQSAVGPRADHEAAPRLERALALAGKLGLP